jgi:16S rRNA C967 or C1407 C5-methylase (RsmB/RsmF family)/NOL1/NOP2/fmu family ribosome biogenesis protein
MNAREWPSEFESAMAGLLGSEWPAFCQTLSERPPISIRINPAKPCGVDTYAPVPWTRYGAYLQSRPVFTLDPRFHAGAYYVQEASSMFLEHVVRTHVDVEKPLNVLDLCAAPGGKSTHLLSTISPRSLLVANETIRSRVAVLSENLERWGHCNVVICNNDPEDFRRLVGFFDLILVDAPCSGEGLFRKNPGASEHWSPRTVERCAARQRRILADVWPALKEGGVLIYSTCTYNKQENEENLAWFATLHGAEFLSVDTPDEWGIVPSVEDNVVGYRFYPHRVRGEGLFLSALRKTEEAVAGSGGKTKSMLANPSPDAVRRLKPWIRDADELHFFIHDNTVHFLPTQKDADVSWIVQHLTIMSAGTAAAAVKHGKVVPRHGLALSLWLDQSNAGTLAVNEAEAIAYLRKEPLRASSDKSGYAVVIFNDLPLGWVNILGNRINNLFPSNRRIRMAAPEVDV